LAADPDLAELVEMFVEEMPERLTRLMATWDAKDLDGLSRLAHQLKGSAGSYGFHEVTPFAHQLEAVLKGHGTESEICHHLQELLGICQQIRSGVPEVAHAASTV
jgi:HPt (histidine-containing phosphotransfer) domain-containing protein